MSNPEQTASR